MDLPPSPKEDAEFTQACSGLDMLGSEPTSGTPYRDFNFEKLSRSVGSVLFSQFLAAHTVFLNLNADD